MVNYLIRRIAFSFVTLFVISLLSFLIIQLPPGDFLTVYVETMSGQGVMGYAEAEAAADAMRARYGLDEPVLVQYWLWISNIIVRGDFGYSFEIRRPVSELIWGVMGNTMILVLASALFIFAVGLPIGYYSAIRQYSVGDYVFSFFGFLGLAIPTFLLALLMLYASYSWFDVLPKGMFSPEMIRAPWSIARFLDMLSNIWIGVVVIGTAGTASVLRILRNNMLDELKKPYVVTARAKGVDEWRLLLKYPARIAIGPILSTVGYILPQLFGATIIASVVLNLQTAGPIYLKALMTQDMYLAGAIMMLLAVFTVAGTIVSDILLAIADPRIRYD